MILVDGPSSVSGDQWLAGLDSPAHGVISVVAEPGSHAFWALESAILARLGQAEAARGSTQNDRRLLRTWGRGYNITDVILNHADHYPAQVLIQLDSILIEIGAVLWLVVEPVLVEAAIVDLRRGFVTPRRLDWKAFERTWRGRSRPVSKRVVTNPSSVERDCVGELERIRAPLRRVDWAYLGGFADIANASGPRVARIRASSDSLPTGYNTKAWVAGRLRKLIDSYPDLGCFAQAVRGAAVALRRMGWMVSLDEGSLAFSACRDPVPCTLEPAALQNVRRTRDPEVAAAAALACLRLAIEEIRDVRVEDLEDDGSAVRVGRDSITVPVELRPMLRAQRISRGDGGADPSHRLIARHAKRFKGQHVAMLVRVGLGLTEGSAAWKERMAAPSGDERWLIDRGVVISRLENLRIRTPRRFESDRLRAEAIKALREGTGGRGGEPCLCPMPHGKPELVNVTFGAYGRLHPAPADHPWRVPW